MFAAIIFFGGGVNGNVARYLTGELFNMQDVKCTKLRNYRYIVDAINCK